MVKHMPPVPPAGRPPRGGEAQIPDPDAAPKDDERNRNLAEQGQQGNIKQNTTHQGYQQDR